MSVLLSNADGTFGEEIEIELPDGDPQNYGIEALGDFDRDGNLDAVITRHQSENNLHVLFGNGDGTFRDPLSLTTSPAFRISVKATDLDADGSVDLIAYQNGSPPQQRGQHLCAAG